MNPFVEKQRVLCIKDNFPVVRTTNEDKRIIGTRARKHPKVGEILIIDEILGEFLRFNEYDQNDPNAPDYSVNWWHYGHFAPVDEFEKEFNELLEKPNKEKVWEEISK